jgi:cytochrome P450
VGIEQGVPMQTTSTAAAEGEIDVDLTDSELYRNGFPHEVFTRLRAQGGVLRHRAVPMVRAPEGFGFWAVIGHPEVQLAGRTWETFSAVDGPRIVPTESARRGHTLTSSDPEAHTRLRKLVSSGFTPRMIARLEQQIVARTTEILDAVAARGGECDFVRDVAYALPMHLIADIVGMPDADRAWVFAQTDRLMRSGDPRSGITPDERGRIELELFGYAQQLGAEKRRRPADDVWSLLAVAEIDDATRGRSQLSDLELDMFFLILSIAGSETTRNVISQGLVALLDHPDAAARLRAAGAVSDTAVDELIRWASPVTSFGRTVTRDVELAGRLLRAGDRITLWFPSANFDERAFRDPFAFDIDRTPNRHVAFGAGGPHFCLGAHLARREIRTMFEQLLGRTTSIERIGPPRWLATGPDSSVAVSLDHLPVRLGFAR